MSRMHAFEWCVAVLSRRYRNFAGAGSCGSEKPALSRAETVVNLVLYETCRVLIIEKIFFKIHPHGLQLERDLWGALWSIRHSWPTIHIFFEIFSLSGWLRRCPRFTLPPFTNWYALRISPPVESNNQITKI